LTVAVPQQGALDTTRNSQAAHDLAGLRISYVILSKK
jgi:hypothetical protein